VGIQSPPRRACVFGGYFAFVLGVGLVPFGNGQTDPVMQDILGLEESRVEVRIQAVKNLRDARDPRAVEPLISALRDTSLSVLHNSAVALVAIGAPAIEPLGALLNDPELEVRRTAIYVLEQIKDPGVVVQLIGALKNPNSDVRQSAASALGRIRDPRAVGPLMPAPNDADNQVRMYADTGPATEALPAAWARDQDRRRWLAGHSPGACSWGVQGDQDCQAEPLTWSALNGLELETGWTRSKLPNCGCGSFSPTTRVK
jgi:HEAT repeat protein